ncbi:MAG: zonular occludens toxin [Thiobacillus sp.]|nr:zonular occludens toxin [Thiobacillus sp.]
MITLITGTPGAGKTLYCVHAILQKEGQGTRPIFVDGIPDLKTRHEPAQDIERWHEWAPDGALIVIDEVQRIWRPTNSSARVPPSIAELETHRHRGIDFVLITQHPNLIHSNVRRLVGRYIHLRRTALGTYLFEWPEATNPEARGNATKIRWTHPKQSFGLYKSASEHTKVSHRMPTSVYVFGFAVLAFLVGLAFAINSIGSKMTGEHYADQQPAHLQKPHQALPSPGLPDVYSPALQNPIIAFSPVYPDIPHSAPAYEGMVPVKSAPLIQGCVASPTRCICYTQQQTRLAISEDLCRRHAAGLEFDPYRQDQAPQQLAMPQINTQAPQGPGQDQALQDGPDRVLTPPVDDFKNPFARSST